jgi:predicted PurR-regulated permease PerM
METVAMTHVLPSVKRAISGHKSPHEKGIRGFFISIGMLVSLVVVLWGLAPALAPFILGAIMAYIYHPLHHRLMSLGVSAGASSLLLALSGYTALMISLWKGVPVLNHWAHDIVYNIHEYAHRIQTGVWAIVQPLVTESKTQAPQWIQQSLQHGIQWVGSFLLYLLYNGWVLIRVAYTLLLAPLVAFYVTKDGPYLWSGVKAILPTQWQPSVRLSLSQCHRSLCLYVAGQWRVSLVSMTYYSFLLHVVLQLPLALGLLTGFMVFFPYIGWATTMVLALLIGVIQSKSWSFLCSIAIIYIGGNVLEGVVLTPYFVGGRTGLHPVWVLLSVVLCGGLMGAFGIIFAIPLATITMALLRLWCRRPAVAGSHLLAGETTQ